MIMFDLFHTKRKSESPSWTEKSETLEVLEYKLKLDVSRTFYELSLANIRFFMIVDVI